MNRQPAQGRRNFLLTSATLGAALVTGSARSQPQIKSATTQLLESVRATPLKQRTLGTGKASMEVTTFGFGCMGMSYHRGLRPDRKAMIALIRKAVDSGINWFDTAEVYGPFANEELVGEALAPVRNDVMICSKFGFDIPNGVPGGMNSRPEHIRQVVEQSLKRLRTDHLDLVYQHRQDPNVPVEDVAGTVKDLIKEGKVKRFGLSEVSPQTIRKAHAIQPLTAVQSEYHLMWKKPEDGVFQTLEELGIGFVAYSPLNRGFLSGMLNEQTKFYAQNDNRASLPRFTPEAMRGNRPIIEVLLAFGNERGLTPSQVALTWLLAQKPWIVSIPGTTKPAHFQENLAAIDLQFSPDELKQLDQAISKITIQGDRYTGEQAKRVGN